MLTSDEITPFDLLVNLYKTQNKYKCRSFLRDYIRFFNKIMTKIKLTKTLFSIKYLDIY